MAKNKVTPSTADRLNQNLKRSGYDMDERARYWDEKLRELERQRQEYIRQGIIKEASDDNPIAGALLNRIMNSRLDLLSKYGPARILDVVNDFADDHGEIDEIGTSDISNWLRSIEQTLAAESRPQMSAEAVNKNVQDIVKMDVPFLLRALEYAREDAKTDIDLHVVVDRMIQAAVEGNTLDMNDYVSVFGEPDVDHMTEDADGLDIGDPVVITGNVQYNGATGEIAEFGMDRRFVVVNLYNHGKRAFHSSDVSINDYADSDAEDADAYDNDSDYRNWSNQQQTEEQTTNEGNNMGKKKNISEGVLDATDEDGWMAKSQLYKTAKYAITLHSMIQDTENLEPWIQAKITRASEDLSAVKHYLEYARLNPQTLSALPDETVGEAAHSQDAMELNPDLRRAGDRPGFMSKLKAGARRVANVVAPDDEDLLKDLQRKVGVAQTGRRPKVDERAKNPYAVGMAQAMKSTGDTPPLKKSTIKKAHEIAKKVASNESAEGTAAQLEQQAVDFYTSIKSKINNQ